MIALARGWTAESPGVEPGEQGSSAGCSKPAPPIGPVRPLKGRRSHQPDHGSHSRLPGHLYSPSRSRRTLPHAALRCRALPRRCTAYSVFTALRLRQPAVVREWARARIALWVVARFHICLRPRAHVQHRRPTVAIPSSVLASQRCLPRLRPRHLPSGFSPTTSAPSPWSPRRSPLCVVVNPVAYIVLNSPQLRNS